MCRHICVCVYITCMHASIHTYIHVYIYMYYIHIYILLESNTTHIRVHACIPAQELAYAYISVSYSVHTMYFGNT